MVDEVIPGFAKRSAKGEVFVNYMSHYKSHREQPTLSTKSYHVEYTPGTPAGNKYCAYNSAQTMPASPQGLNQLGSPVQHLRLDIGASVNLRTLAGTQAAAGIDNPTLDGAVAIAELREALSFMRNPLRALNRELVRVRRDKWRDHGKWRTKTTSEYLRDNWLSYRYGVRPLVKDVQDAAHAVARTALNDEPKRQTSRGSASESFHFSSDGKSGDFDFITETRVEVDVEAGVLYELALGPNTFGLGLQRVPVAVWEAIPYSFVVDWFANIGSFVSAITPVAGVRRLGSWTTTTVTHETTRKIWWARGGIHSSGMPRVIESDGQSTEQFSSSTKTRVPGIIVGLAHTTSPFSGDIGQKRLIDLVALGHQILASK
jgi:hypothetical protein